MTAREGALAQRRNRGADARRAQILSEALHLVGQNGYYGFGISELAQRCKLTKPGLLHHFGSKDKLLIELVEERDQQLATELRDVLASIIRGRTPDSLSKDEVLSTFHEIVVRNNREPEVVRFFTVLQTESLSQTHPAHAFFTAREARVLNRYIEMLAPHVENPISAARQFMALMGGLERQWLRSGQSFDLVAEWDSAAARLLEANARQKKANGAPRKQRQRSAAAKTSCLVPSRQQNQQ